MRTVSPKHSRGDVAVQCRIPVLTVGLSDEDQASICRSLTGQKLEILNTLDCRDARARLEDGSRPVVITEVNLPDGTWRDIVALSRQLSSPPAVIVASRLADERTWAEVLNLGGFDLIPTPLDCQETARIVLAARRQWNREGSRLTQDD